MLQTIAKPPSAAMVAERCAHSAVLTFDIEEWFQVENLRAVFPRASWDDRPRRAGDGTRVVLDLLDAHGVRAPVVGYRAPSFSISERHLKILSEYFFRYDSSFHPFALHRRYGRLAQLGTRLRAGVYRTGDGLIELALPVERFAAASFPVSGGGYFRVLPAALFRRLVQRALVRDGHYIMYLHSWEFDPAQPRVRGANLGARFRHYHNLVRTLPRMQRLIPHLQSLGTRFVTATKFVDGVLAPRGAAHGG